MRQKKRKSGEQPGDYEYDTRRYCDDHPYRTFRLLPKTGEEWYGVYGHLDTLMFTCPAANAMPATGPKNNTPSASVAMNEEYINPGGREALEPSVPDRESKEQGGGSLDDPYWQEVFADRQNAALESIGEEYDEQASPNPNFLDYETGNS